MRSNDWSAEQSRLIQILKDKLRNKESCADVIDAFEDVMFSIWAFSERLIGKPGTAMVLARSVKLAARDVPVLGKLKVGEDGIDFAEFRDSTEKVHCSTPEAVDSLMRLGAMIFETLSQMAGEALTKPMTRLLEKQTPPAAGD